jgi:hypothetical protein
MGGNKILTKIKEENMKKVKKLIMIIIGLIGFFFLY